MEEWRIRVYDQEDVEEQKGTPDGPTHRTNDNFHLFRAIH
jgi:hypothetical protein